MKTWWMTNSRLLSNCATSLACSFSYHGFPLTFLQRPIWYVYVPKTTYKGDGYDIKPTCVQLTLVVSNITYISRRTTDYYRRKLCCHKYEKRNNILLKRSSKWDDEIIFKINFYIVGDTKTFNKLAFWRT